MTVSSAMFCIIVAQQVVHLVHPRRIIVELACGPALQHDHRERRPRRRSPWPSRDPPIRRRRSRNHRLKTLHTRTFASCRAHFCTRQFLISRRRGCHRYDPRRCCGRSQLARRLPRTLSTPITWPSRLSLRMRLYFRRTCRWLLPWARRRGPRERRCPSTWPGTCRSRRRPECVRYAGRLRRHGLGIENHVVYQVELPSPVPFFPHCRTNSPCGLNSITREFTYPSET